MLAQITLLAGTFDEGIKLCPPESTSGNEWLNDGTGATDMTKNLDCLEGPAISALSESGRFDQISIVLHWLTVLLIVVQFTSAWLRETVDHETRLAAAILSVHSTTGVLTWIIGLLRFLWRHNFAYLPPFPPHMPKFQQTIAKVNEYGLYLLLFVQPLTGLGRILLRGQPFNLFFWEVPQLLEPEPAIRGFLADAHDLGAKALLILIGVHAGAALFHRLILRDGVLQRMSPWTAARTNLTPVLVKDEAE
jgi:cytochrome b561